MRLLSEMIDVSGYGDSQLPKDIGRGFDLLGPIPDSSGVLPKKASFASLSVPEVREVANDNQRCVWQATMDSLRTDTDLEVAREVYKLTLSERDAGWVKGPFALCDLPNDAILTRRFGVVQSSWDSQKGSVKKIRPIDDFTESLANQASRPKTGCCEWWVAGRGSCSSVETHGQQRSVPSVAWNHTALQSARLRMLFLILGRLVRLALITFHFHGFHEFCHMEFYNHACSAATADNMNMVMAAPVPNPEAGTNEGLEYFGRLLDLSRSEGWGTLRQGLESRLLFDLPEHHSPAKSGDIGQPHGFTSARKRSYKRAILRARRRGAPWMRATSSVPMKTTDSKLHHRSVGRQAAHPRTRSLRSHSSHGTAGASAPSKMSSSHGWTHSLFKLSACKKLGTAVTWTSAPGAGSGQSAPSSGT